MIKLFMIQSTNRKTAVVFPTAVLFDTFLYTELKVYLDSSGI